MSFSERAAIIGVGAVGGYLGAHLAKSGADVILIDPWADQVSTMRANGLRVSAV